MTQLQAQAVLSVNFEEELRDHIRRTIIDVLSDMPNPSTPQPTVYNLGEAAKAARISRNTLARWIKMGLPIIMIGGVQRIKHSDLETFMEEYKI